MNKRKLACVTPFAQRNIMHVRLCLQVVGPLCFSDCPSDVPYRCGLLCTGDNGTCSDQTAALSFAGFEVVYGLALFGVSLGTAIGSAGASSFVSGFGIVAGVGTIGMGWSDIARKLIEYPFCSNDTERAQMMAELDHNQKIFPSKLAETCSYLFPNTTTQ